jgi:hypothetical protein
MDIFQQLAEKIIREQESIIGPVALEQAQKVPGLKIDLQNHAVQLEGDQRGIIESLIEKYRDLFGLASVQVCKDAARPLLTQIPQDQVPPSLLN